MTRMKRIRLLFLLISASISGCSGRDAVHVPKGRKPYERPLVQLELPPVSSEPISKLGNPVVRECGRVGKNTDLEVSVRLSDHIRPDVQIVAIEFESSDGKTADVANLFGENKKAESLVVKTLMPVCFRKAGEYQVRVFGMEFPDRQGRSSKLAIRNAPMERLTLAEYKLIVTD